MPLNSKPNVIFPTLPHLLITVAAHFKLCGAVEHLLLFIIICILIIISADLQHPSCSSGVAQWPTVLRLYKQLPGVTVCLTVNVKQGFSEKQHESSITFSA